MSAAGGSGGLELDRLPDPAAPLDVRTLDAMQIAPGGSRRPHRHDYHELVWIREGAGRQCIDGEPFAVQPSSVTIIGRGQVHVFAEAAAVRGVAIRFGEELLAGDEGRDAAAWLLAAPSGRPIGVPRGEVPHLEAVIAALAAEATRPVDPTSVQLQRHLLATVLLWLERWYDASRTERRPADDDDVELHRRFTRLLEAEYASHHDAGWYADRLRVPPATLSRALARATGRGTKEHVSDRVMLEAQRLLRFADLTVGEVAARVGFVDPLYFSRAFKRHAGESPLAYRGRVRGKSMHP